MSIDIDSVEFDWSAKGFHSEAGWEHQLFDVSLTVGGKTEHFEWRQGMGIDHEPRLFDVLDSLILDARGGRESFEDFCDDYGYETDSRRAYSMWEACGRIAAQLINLFGEIPNSPEDN